MAILEECLVTFQGDEAIGDVAVVPPVSELQADGLKAVEVDRQRRHLNIKEREGSRNYAPHQCPAYPVVLPYGGYRCAEGKVEEES